jgi:hypothetical protein
MKNYFLIALLSIITAIVSCKKSVQSGDNNPQVTVKTVGNMTTYPNGNVVKSIGVTRILLGVDKNDKLTVAEIFGGGNKVIFKPGTGNTVEMPGGGGYGELPDGFPPDGSAYCLEQVVDNGKMPLDTSGGQAMCIKIKGFDKAKTGYNQLNLVMYKLVRATPPGDAGYYDDIAYITYDSDRKHSDYNGDFFKSLFTGNINVADVEIAQPAAQKPYITEDETVFMGETNYSYQYSACYNMDLESNTFGVSFGTPPPFQFSFGGTLNYQWVNANQGTVTEVDKGDEYKLLFNNIMSYDQIVEPADTTNKVFLRITGFDPTVTGFNQLRLFIAKGPTIDDGSIFLFSPQILTSIPTFEAAKTAFLPVGIFCEDAAPYVQ